MYVCVPTGHVCMSEYLPATCVCLCTYRPRVYVCVPTGLGGQFPHVKGAVVGKGDQQVARAGRCTALDDGQLRLRCGVFVQSRGVALGVDVGGGREGHIRRRGCCGGLHMSKSTGVLRPVNQCAYIRANPAHQSNEPVTGTHSSVRVSLLPVHTAQ